MSNISLEKSHKKYGGETSPRAFFKKSKLSLSLDQLSKFLYRLFLLYAKLRAISPHITLFFFFKKKRGLELVSFPHFLHDFWVICVL